MDPADVGAVMVLQRMADSAEYAQLYDMVCLPASDDNEPPYLTPSDFSTLMTNMLNAAFAGGDWSLERFHQVQTVWVDGGTEERVVWRSKL